MRLSFRNQQAVVTGGLGFTGSNLSLRLLELGARGTVADSEVQGCGSNRRNLEPARGEIRLILGQPPEVFGDGSQLRDPLYVEDAVAAFLLAGAAPKPPSHVCNVGGQAALPLSRIAQTAHAVAGGPAPVFRPFPDEGKAIDIGSYYTDSSRIRRELGWRPATPFAEGIGRTLSYYERELPHYLDRNDPNPSCALIEQDPAKAVRYASR